jgi:hypothetical protein
MFLRERRTDTLSDIAEQLNTNGIGWGGSTLGIRPHLTEETPFFELERPEGSNVQVPVTATGMEQIAAYMDIPRPFMERLGQDDPELRQIILERRFARDIKNVALTYVPDEGIIEAYNPNQQRVQPRDLLTRVMNVMDPGSQVIELINEPDFFRLDTVVQEAADFGVGGRQEGDITAGGLRVEYDRSGKNGHAPSVSRLLYRLACTNGYEGYDEGLKIDIRGATVDQILAEVETMAQRAFGQLEAEIAAFYDLRNQRVEGDVTQRVIRIAEEQGLRPRVAHALSTRVPEITDDQGGATMFDVVNLITNAANEPSVRRSVSRSRTLERIGGNLITEHVERCGHCSQRLN